MQQKAGVGERSGCKHSRHPPRRRCNVSSVSLLSYPTWAECHELKCAHVRVEAEIKHFAEKL